MTCEGPATAIQMLTQVFLKRTLPWKMNTAPLTHPGAYLDNQITNSRQDPGARPEIPFKHSTISTGLTHCPSNPG